MKLNQALKRTVLFAFFTLIIQALGNLFRRRVFWPTSYERIVKMNEAFKHKKQQYNDFDLDEIIKVKQSDLDPILKDLNSAYVVAVLGWKGQGHKLHLEITGSNKEGNGLANPTPQIKEDHKKFKDKIKRRIPMGLRDVPLRIKMEKPGLLRIAEATKCKYFLFYLAVDNQICPPATTSPDFDYLTISVLGSEPDAERVSRLHVDGAVYGEETWPMQNFVWSKGVEIPEP